MRLGTPIDYLSSRGAPTYTSRCDGWSVSDSNWRGLGQVSPISLGKIAVPPVTLGTQK
jgi:hypothetical protein